MLLLFYYLIIVTDDLRMMFHNLFFLFVVKKSFVWRSSVEDQMVRSLWNHRIPPAGPINERLVDPMCLFSFDPNFFFSCFWQKSPPYVRCVGQHMHASSVQIDWDNNVRDGRC